MQDVTLSNMSYTNKSFQEIYPELLEVAKNLSNRWDPTQSNESDPGVVLIKLMALVGDKLNYNIDKNVLECFPVSVTQEANARNLFNQLGYRMKHYISATADVSIRWKQPGSGYSYTIPGFTMVADNENNVIYTLLKSVDVKDNGDVVKCEAIQGSLQTLTVNGNQNISVQNLDSNNRLYFPTTNVAENGIYIDSNKYSYDSWEMVDNLEVVEPNKPVYKFGVSDDGKCYIEFPNDCYKIFGNGIIVKYIISDGEDGNIAANVIEKFFNSPSIDYIDVNNVEQSIILSSDVISVTNESSILNGSNPETIAEAYRNYKKTIGTFNTLVTLRDYNNAIRTAKVNNTNLVSNGFICDRTNDIQCSYEIIEDTNAGQVSNQMVEHEDDKPLMTAFDLKMVVLENIASSGDIIYNKTKDNYAAKIYNSTFNILDDNDYAQSYKVDQLKGYLNQLKSLQHDFKTPISKKICMLKNKYAVPCKIVPQTRVTEQQASDIKNNVMRAIYNNFNAKCVEFGDSVDYDYLYNVIQSSDNRIKSVILDDITYDTYAVYYDPELNEYVEVKINDFDNYESGYRNPSDNQFYYDYDANTNTYTNKMKIDNIVLSKTCKSTASDNKKIINLTSIELSNILDSNKNIINGLSILVNFSNEVYEHNTEVFLDVVNAQTGLTIKSFPIKQYIDGQYVDIIKNSSIYWKSGDSRKLTFNGSFWVASLNRYDDNSYIDTIYVDRRDGKCYAAINGTITLDSKSNIQKEIYAKSVLSGKTQLLTPDDEFPTYMTNQFVKEIDNVESLSTSSDIYVTSPGGIAEYTLRDNESLKFYAPNLEDSIVYSNYVKFQFALMQTVEANTDYMLSGNESIVFFIKESDDEASLYKYVRYSAGDIIKPSFTLNQSDGYYSIDDNDVVEYHNSDDVKFIGKHIYDKSGYCTQSDSQYLSKISNNIYILSAQKQIAYRTKIEVTISYPQYHYWILNNKNIDDSGLTTCELFGSAIKLAEAVDDYIVQEYILQPGEYYFHANSTMSNLEILTAGTKITRKSKADKLLPLVCSQIDSDRALTDSNSIKEVWQQINSGESLTLTEMQIKTLPPKSTIYLDIDSWSADLSMASQPAADLMGTRIFGNGVSPTSDSVKLKATSGSTAYNLEYDSNWQWIEDTDDDGNSIYRGDLSDVYGENINVQTVLPKIADKVKQVGKDPYRVGVEPGETLVKINTPYIPQFVDNTFYYIDEVDGSVKLLLDKPDDWETNNGKYLWYQPKHAYNAFYESNTTWKKDTGVNYKNEAPFLSSWLEDMDSNGNPIFIALGKKLMDEGASPDIREISQPEDYANNTLDVVNIDYIYSYSLSGKLSSTDLEKLRNLHEYKYIHDLNSNKWYKNNHSSPVDREAKDTYRIYNPKYKSIGTIWTKDYDGENSILQKTLIKITGEGCSPYKCILQTNNSSEYCFNRDNLFNNEASSGGTVWKIERLSDKWERLQSAPSDVTPANVKYSEQRTIQAALNELSPIINSVVYIGLVDKLKPTAEQDVKYWYKRDISPSSNWVVAGKLSDFSADILNNAIELEGAESDPTTGNYVSIKRNPNYVVVNSATDSSNVEIYEPTYYKVENEYVGKSWQHIIILDRNFINVEKLDGDPLSTPESSGITPSIDENGNPLYAYNKYYKYVWLEDYSYSFDDEQATGTAYSSLGSAKPVTGEGVTPDDPEYGVIATKGARAYNPAYSYKYKWIEDVEYIQWKNPIRVLSGDETPYSSNISFMAVDQHVINPEYVSGYRWIRLNSAPVEYASELIANLQNNNKITVFSDDNLTAEPTNVNINDDNNTVVYGVNITNPTSPVWWQVSEVLGKSWTSVREPIGKSWTSTSVLHTDTWTSTNEYVGKSWHSARVNMQMAWRSVSSPINVLFNNSGYTVISPSNATLSDFRISSKLEDSSEVEQWPKIIVDGGWKAESSFDIKSSSNNAMDIYEDQYVTAYSRNMSTNEVSESTLRGRYIWDEVSYIDDIIQDSMYELRSDGFEYPDPEQSSSKNLIKCNLVPTPNSHVYSDDSSYVGVLIQELVKDSVGDYIFGSKLTTDISKEHPETAGEHFYSVDDMGNIESWTSQPKSSGECKWVKAEEFSQVGVYVENIVELKDKNIPAQYDDEIKYLECSVPSSSKAYIINTQNDVVTNIIPKYKVAHILSDYDYDMQGGQNINISRESLSGLKELAKLFVYEDMYYNTASSYDGITTIGNNLIFRIDNYIESTGKKENIKVDIPIKFKNGKYLLKLSNIVHGIRNLKISFKKTADSTEQPLKEFRDSSLYNFNKYKNYYINLNIDELISLDNSAINDYSVYYLVIDIELDLASKKYGDIIFKPLFKYIDNDNIQTSFMDAVICEMNRLDSNGIFDYSNIVSNDILIKNPLSSNSFFDKNHMYNKYTICQVDTGNTDIIVTNTIKY